MSGLVSWLSAPYYLGMANETTNHGCASQDVARAIEESKAISGDIVTMAYSGTAARILAEECNSCSGATYYGWDLYGNEWTVELK